MGAFDRPRKSGLGSRIFEKVLGVFLKKGSSSARAADERRAGGGGGPRGPTDPRGPAPAPADPGAGTSGAKS